jgi:hypothetical protein
MPNTSRRWSAVPTLCEPRLILLLFYEPMNTARRLVAVLHFSVLLET